MKFINNVLLLAYIATAAAAPSSGRASDADMVKRECDHDAVQRCILACTTQCVAAGPGMGACIEGCTPQCGPVHGC
ncbi:hypothetical protein FSARC_14079 [Fusarium sarcochroum]|uniref:Uncharacterized protein n=1 Tax=Fusarium sarcochroum TaxID=1208366 RepID=A0A8H4SWR1_9HYPO|nr:hypothetical protein FSARC_14079 [Fusarium sarcochroum]